MVKVKKRASKRLGVAQREKVKKKVREHHRKQRKEAKKNPQWKSKIKKDPGIPNSFPYKEQMLNEIEATKRRQEEEKLALREAKRAERKKLDAKGTQTEESDEPGAEEPESEDIELEDGAEDDFAGLPMTAPLFRGSLNELLQSSEIKTIIMTLDARDPQSFRSPWLEKRIKQARPAKSLVIALGRADMVPSEMLAQWVAYLSVMCKAPVFPIASLPDKLDQSTGGAQQLVDSLNLKGKAKGDVAVLGLGYSGRSTVADAILNAIGLPEDEDDTDWPAVLDTPALVPQKGSEAAEQSDDEDDEDDDEEEDDDHKSMLKLELKSMQTLMRNQGHVQRIKEPLPLAWALLSRVSHPEDLMLIYNVPAFGSFQIEKASLADQELEDDERDRLAAAQQREKVHADAEEFLIALARASGRMKKRNMPDPIGASRVLLRDWSHQMLGYYTQAPKIADSTALEQAKAKVTALSSSVVLPRKEWRKKYQARELRLKPISSVLGREALVLEQVEMLPPPPEEDSDDELDLDQDEDEVEDATLAQESQEEESDDDDDVSPPLPKSILKSKTQKRTAKQQQDDSDDEMDGGAAQPSRKERRTTSKKARISAPAKPKRNGVSKPSSSASAARATSAATGPAPGESYDFGAFF